jgi:trans-aconitate 2-methyltransferase
VNNPTPRNWDAKTYAAISAPQRAWAQEQFARIGELNGDELILDAGCGSGNVTAQLLEMVPNGRVYAVDYSPAMVEHTQELLGERVIASCQDLQELQLPEPVDLIFSNATFHWIPDHQKLFNALHQALKPGGRLVAQCGGKGNIDQFRAVADAVAAQQPFAEHMKDDKPWLYADADETRERLANAGFSEIDAWLEPRPTNLDDPRPFITTVCLLPMLNQLPDTLHDQFVDQVLATAGAPPTLDYVRLNMTARRAG